ncbi:rhodanese-like domain-containing protein [Maridesulfovibrio ferrireducens]|uniref:rhodanese-like domain-containing protein n=1 Tax=Maridesulfovibrio ferrireducens TaxID=246191 RepID=UPI001A24CECF|nr:rhodanese-like domain-containing protein [Maridesulfovibrio ferrireducens]MBI9110721.1 rhodanese-like domain-containing protein [Maridesulfovibrio ferrireducens]
MKGFDDVLTEMDFDFLGSGQHVMSVEGVRKALGNDHFIFLDVRTDLEQGYMVFPFAINIPLHELPKRINELPKDKFIVPFCTSIFRSAVAYTYLRANGFDEVKGLAAPVEDLVGIFKPGPLAKM